MNKPAFQSNGSDMRYDLNSSVQSLLLPAQGRFRDLIPQRINALEACRINIRIGNNPEAALEEVIGLSHKIAGVAETLGFPKPGRLAAIIDQQFGEALNRNTAASEIWGDLEPKLVALIDELALLRNP